MWDHLPVTNMSWFLWQTDKHALPQKAIVKPRYPKGGRSFYLLSVLCYTVKHNTGNTQYLIYESVLVPHSSLKCNSKFPVGMSKFPVQTQNFQFKLEISSSDLDTLSSCNLWITSALIPLLCRKHSMVNEPIRWNNYITNQQLKISTSSNWKFRVQSGNFDFQTGNFDFGKLEISTSQLEISSSNSKFRLRQTGNFDIPTGNFEFKLEISTSANWKFRHPNWKFRVQTRNFEFKLEISSSNSKFRVAFQARMWHQYAFVLISLYLHLPNKTCE